MVRVFLGASVLGALACSAATGVAAVAAPQPLSLALHRLDTGARPARADTYQRRRLLSSPFENVPLNLGMGTHYAWVYVGTPPQRASVITDTGSSIMAFPCSECENCGTHTDQPFASANSSTLTHVTCAQADFFRCTSCQQKDVCDIYQSYMEGSSWHATVVEDIVYLGGESSFTDARLRDSFGTHFKFGCQNRETGLFITQVADGIMGLANNDNHIIAKLFREKKIPNKMFGLCFAEDGGSMSIGAPDTSRHKGQIQYAKLKANTGMHDFYAVHVKDVRIGGMSVPVDASTYSHGQYIVDSGTTDSYFPKSMKAAFSDLFRRMSGLEYRVSSQGCHGYTDSDIEKLPNIEIVLGAHGDPNGNVTLLVPPHQYLIKEDSNTYCSSLFLSESSGGVIGANIMTNRDVIFDQENQRVGFVDADCLYQEPPVVVPQPGTANASASSSSGMGTDDDEVTAPSTLKSRPPAIRTSNPSAKPKARPTPEPAENPTEPTEPTENPTEPPATTAPPSPSPSPSATEVPTTEEPTTEAPTAEPTPEATTSSPVPSETPAPTTSEPAVTKTPKPTLKSSHNSKPVSNSANSEAGGSDDHPMVLTVVGTCLAVAFLMVVAISVRRHKKSNKDQWSRVNEEDGGDGDSDSDDDEEELIDHTSKSKKSRRKSDGVDEDDDKDDDDDDLEGGRHGHSKDDDDDDDDDDDEDEIFDRDVHGRSDELKHDARTLERL
ncbi:hypothetical protein PINS_up002199 [Pythium insidiosum]|nr:hypothetical protein PINS_up002199 [Pythium insidiosum]